MSVLRTVTWSSVAYGIVLSLHSSSNAPIAWAYFAFLVWVLFVVHKGVYSLHVTDKHQLAWGYFSTAAFVVFLRKNPTFEGWQDVYFFCGREMEFCSCELKWNMAGWMKALVLWNFALSTALAVQKLVIQVGLKGLLPGEEVVTKESFISICWRLIPYCLNNWEKQWGAECSSMMFELPHFALELLVILPCVQILCARLKIVAMPIGRIPRAMQFGILHGQNGGEMAHGISTMAPCVIDGAWKPMLGQELLLPRLRTNLRMLLVILAVVSGACLNALYLPLHLESQIFKHPRAAHILAASQACNSSETCWDAMLQGHPVAPFNANSAYPARCQNLNLTKRAFMKHGLEMGKMRSPLHTELLPVVEIALAALRMSCERFFLLLSIYVAYLVWHSDVPPYFKALIRLNHRLSKVFQKIILYAFPAVCWIYGAGTVFSTFVSLIFWVAPAKRAYQHLRRQIAVVQPLGLRNATKEQIEMMNDNCTVCWGAMTVARPPNDKAHSSVGVALSCGHAFHRACINRWLAQCHGQGRSPTCPLCNQHIKLQVKFRFPALRWNIPHDPQADDQAELEDLGIERGIEEVVQLEGVGPVHQFAFQDQQGLAQTRSAANIEDRNPVLPPARAGQAEASGSLDHVRLHHHTSQEAAGQPMQRVQEATSAPCAPSSRFQPQQAFEHGGCLRHRPRSVRRDANSPDICSAAAMPACCTSDHNVLQFPGDEPSQPTSSQHAELDSERRSSAFCKPGDHCRQFHTALSSRLYQTAGQSQGCREAGLDSGTEGLVRGRSAAGSATCQDDLVEAVHQDRVRAMAYLEFCKAQEAQLQAQIQLNKEVLEDAKQTALELLVNANMMEKLVEPRTESAMEVVAEQRYRNRHSHRGGKEMCEELVTEMWQRQQKLWQKSQALHSQLDNLADRNA